MSHWRCHEKWQQTTAARMFQFIKIIIILWCIISAYKQILVGSCNQYLSCMKGGSIVVNFTTVNVLPSRIRSANLLY